MMLDYIEKFDLSEEDLNKYFNEIRSLRYLKIGLDYLYKFVKSIELEVVKRLDPNIRYFSYGNDPTMAGIPLDLIACHFHWYAVSACNYVQMVGWLRHNVDQESSRPTDYTKSVLPEVYDWRNKVAAHFARAKPHSKDTPADLQASTFFPIAFDDDAFYASPMKLMTKRGGKSSTSDNLRKWSLTKVHERLQTRYWQEHTSG